MHKYWVRLVEGVSRLITVGSVMMSTYLVLHNADSATTTTTTDYCYSKRTTFSVMLAAMTIPQTDPRPRQRGAILWDQRKKKDELSVD